MATIDVKAVYQRNGQMVAQVALDIPGFLPIESEVQLTTVEIEAFAAIRSQISDRLSVRLAEPFYQVNGTEAKPKTIEFPTFQTSVPSESARSAIVDAMSISKTRILGS